jgi:hypothetical protein
MGEAQKLFADILREASCTDVKVEGEWNFTFDDETVLRVGCLWRLVVQGRVALSGDDHLQKFGLDTPVDAGESAMRILSGKIVSAVELHEGTADIGVEFSDGTRLELVKNSSGYEPWGVSSKHINMFANGSGDVFLMEPKPLNSTSPTNVVRLGDGFRKISLDP